MTVKIECDCGQHFAFDVEPVDGRMDSAVACPACGTDGTEAANEIISRALVPPPAIQVAPAAPEALVIPPKTGGALRFAPSNHPASAAESKITVDARALGIVERDQAEAEARAKISWGDAPEEVVKYLMLQRFSHAEAEEFVAELFKERMATVRANGIRKIIIGVALMCVPVVAYLFFNHLGVIPLKLMAIFVMIGLWGVWQLLNGIIALVAPKMESGDVAEQ